MMLLHIHENEYIPVKLITRLRESEALIFVPIANAWVEQALAGIMVRETDGVTGRFWRVQAHRLLPAME